MDMPTYRKRVIVAMSGGVDSSLTAALLKERGYEVIGVTMRLWTVENMELSPHHRSCCSVEQVDDARRVCQVLDIPYYVLNFEREFRTFVVDYFVREYQQGRTPNPCLACNQHVKFHFLLRRALALGADYLATGHYARIDRVNGRYRLLKGVDHRKDQSYVLFTLGQWELSHLLFPLGDYTKAEVRRMAAERHLPVAQKPDSQEICFIPENDYRRFLMAEGVRVEPGNIVDTQGRVLGRHKGAAFYTVGQRHGLGIATGEPLYVIAIDPVNNVVVVGHRNETLSHALTAEEVNWIAGEPPSGPIEVMAKIRYRSPEVPAVVIPLSERRVRVEFRQAQRAVTPGQAVVFYQGEEVLGGGIIEHGETGGSA